MNFPSATQRIASIALLTQWGIDANQVCADGWDEEGYETFVTRDEGGGRVIVSGEPARAPHAWPKGFPVDQLVAIRGGYR